MRISPRNRGLPTITATMREFTIGQKACVKLDGRVHKGMPHPRYQGQTGIVVGRQGRAFLLQIIQGSKVKLLVVGPEHLQRN
jgi:large subunit ribosomal protein L21e